MLETKSAPSMAEPNPTEFEEGAGKQCSEYGAVLSTVWSYPVAWRGSVVAVKSGTYI